MTLIARVTLILAAALSVARPASAQTRLPPGVTPDQVASILASNPAYQQQLRQRLLQSGLTLPEIQERLRAAGMPPNMLDAYYTPGGDGTTSKPVDAETVRAIAMLGVDAFPPEITGAADRVVARLRADSALAESVRPPAERLRLFGLDVLRQPGTQFQPVSGPVDDGYPLGAGDQVVLFITGGVEDTHVLDVTSQGFVVIPRVGQVYVNSLTLGQFRSLLYDRLTRVYSGVSRSPDARTRFDLAVAKVRVQGIRVAGEVARPGTYQVAATNGVLSAIYQAGGVSELGTFRAVEIRRGRAMVATVDLYEYLLKGIVGGEPQLQSGDVVFVPVHGPRIRIAGEVHRPAIYELTPRETLRDAIRIAGGLTPHAATQSVTIDRLLPPGQRPEPGYVRTVYTASLREVLDSTAAPTALFAEDSVTVYRETGGRRASVTVDGSVVQPGTYRLESGMRLWDLFRTARGLRADAYGGRVQVLRTQPDSTRRLLGFELDSTAPSANPALQESDQVTVYGTTAFRPQRYVTVYGSVSRPATIPFADSMTLRDAILYAGGLREDAYLGEAEISRLRERHTTQGDSLAVILRVPMDSSYVVDSTGYIRRPVGAASPQVMLSPYDNVFVRQQPGWELQRNVALGGEVRFPGRYTLTTKDERLSSVLARAGGLSPNAYPQGVQLYRRSGDGAGRIAVDLPRVLRDQRHKDNVILAAGDSIYIPPFIPTVRVEGAVNFPTSVTYQPGAGLSYYVDAAGGYGAQADQARTFIRQPNGLVQRGGRPEPGAAITVPQRDPNERRAIVELMPLFTAAVQVLAASATLIIALVK